jgi:heme-degrading monooxygenase HmoA
MILEVARLDVRPGQEGAFEEAFKKASPLISRMQGCLRHQLRRCLENHSRYVLLVEW